MSKIKRKHIDGAAEKQMTLGAIISSRFLREFRTIHRPEYVEAPYAKQVISWCLQYFDKYEKAPGEDIQDIFNRFARKDPDDVKVELIAEFLESISDEFEQASKFNVDYLLDQTEHRFKVKALENLTQDIRAELLEDNVLEAEALLSQFKRPGRPSESGINPFTNEEAIYDAFEEERDPLIKLPGALGQMLNDELVRDAFVSYMGHEKVGKTFMLQELAIWALKSRSNVAFFAVGDMTKRQMIRRKLIRITGKSDLRKYCGELLIPVLDCERNQSDKCTHRHRQSSCGLEDAESFEDAPAKYKPCTHCEKHHPHKFKGAVWYKERPPVDPLTWREGLDKGERFMSRVKGVDYKLIAYPNSTVNVDDLEAQLDIWEHFEDFVADVIIVDYADILAPQPGNREFRHQQNETWKALRRLSQKRHALVITATQTDAASYEVETLRQHHFSEDKRKYSHVTGMLGINQMESEKEVGIMRLNWVMLREGDFIVNRTVKLLQSLQTGRPFLGSYW